jgi:hypothetical protein
MIKVLLMVGRKSGITVEQFRDYYEGNHASLAVRTLPASRKYARNYPESSFGEMPSARGRGRATQPQLRTTAPVR